LAQKLCGDWLLLCLNRTLANHIALPNQRAERTPSWKSDEKGAHSKLVAASAGAGIGFAVYVDCHEPLPQPSQGR
jgi:hypothetical protein